MKLEGVSAFVAIANTGSISEAARHLRLSKSAVSERLTELERALDANLLHRNSRQLSLTEDGAAFLERAKRIIGEAAEAANELASRRGEVAGPLRIAAGVLSVLATWDGAVAGTRSVIHFTARTSESFWLAGLMKTCPSPS